jgi:hypothetical protein
VFHDAGLARDPEPRCESAVASVGGRNRNHALVTESFETQWSPYTRTWHVNGANVTWLACAAKIVVRGTAGRGGLETPPPIETALQWGRLCPADPR